jgi:hypothetical protein
MFELRHGVESGREKTWFIFIYAHVLLNLFLAGYISSKLTLKYYLYASL